MFNIVTTTNITCFPLTVHVRLTGGCVRNDVQFALTTSPTANVGRSNAIIGLESGKSVTKKQQYIIISF
jgi:hypothetical protein